MRPATDACGCFPTGRHYPGIAHLLKTVVVGLVPGISQEAPWRDLEIALLDVETTGRDASTDRVVELGIAVGKAGEIVARYNWLINPGVPIPDGARAVHGISDEDVKDAPSFASVAHEIAKALEGRVPGAYNAGFDKGFVTAEFARLGQPALSSAVVALRRDVEWIDPLVWAREIQKSERSRTLGDVAERLGISLEKAHRASEDAEAALRVLWALAEGDRVPAAYGAAVSEQRRLGLAQADARRRWQR